MDLWDEVSEKIENREDEKRSNLKNTRTLLLKLGREDLIAFSRIYVNKNDPFYELLKSIKPIKGFEDFMIHGQPNLVEYETTNGQWIQYTPQDFADFLREDKNGYTGGNIRLLACKSGMLDNGFAQQLANIMNVNVIAPTQTLWIKQNGEMFIDDNMILAELWDKGEKVKQKGAWKLFTPQQKGD